MRREAVSASCACAVRASSHCLVLSVPASAACIGSVCDPNRQLCCASYPALDLRRIVVVLGPTYNPSTCSTFSASLPLVVQRKYRCRVRTMGRQSRHEFAAGKPQHPMRMRHGTNLARPTSTAQQFARKLSECHHPSSSASASGLRGSAACNRRPSAPHRNALARERRTLQDVSRATCARAAGAVRRVHSSSAAWACPPGKASRRQGAA